MYEQPKKLRRLGIKYTWILYIHKLVSDVFGAYKYKDLRPQVTSKLDNTMDKR